MYNAVMLTSSSDAPPRRPRRCALQLVEAAARRLAEHGRDAADRAAPGGGGRRVHAGRVHALRRPRRPARRGVAGGLPALRRSRSTRRRSPTTRWPTASRRGGGYRHFALRNPHLYRVDVRRRASCQVRARAPARTSRRRRPRSCRCSSASSAASRPGGGRSTTSGPPARSSGRWCTVTCSSSCPGTSSSWARSPLATFERGLAACSLGASATTRRWSSASLAGGPPKRASEAAAALTQN